MTPTITQHVVPRRRPANPVRWQRGSISSTTITITLGITVILAVTFLSFFYLGQVQDTASRGSEIQNLEEHLTKLRERQRSLELESARLRSIQTIEKRVPELNLVATNHVTYIAQPHERVAVRTR